MSMFNQPVATQMDVKDTGLPAPPPERARQSEEDRKLLETLNGLYQEAAEYRSSFGPGGMCLEDQWDANGQDVLGNQWASNSAGGAVSLKEGARFYQFSQNDNNSSVSGLKRVVLNRTGGALLSNVATETQDPAVVQWEPTEGGAPEEYYLSPAGAQIMAGLVEQDRQQAEMAAVEGMEPSMGSGFATMGLTPEQLASVEPLSQDQGEYLLGMVETGGLPQDALFVLDDVADAELAQKLWD